MTTHDTSTAPGTTTTSLQSPVPSRGRRAVLVGVGVVSCALPTVFGLNIARLLLTGELAEQIAAGGAVFSPTVAARLRGHDNRRIARELFLSEKTVRNQVSMLLGKLEVADRAEAIARARRAGLGQEPPS